MHFKSFFFSILIACSSLCADAITMATWVDSASSNHPYYSIYNGTSWSIPATITTASGGSYDVSSACNPKTGTVVATWVDVNTQDPYYAVYMSGSWSSAQTITSNPSLNGYLDVNVTFNPVTDEFMATWGLNSDSTPYYSLYNGSTWSTPAPIATPADVLDVVFAAANTSTGDVVASWVTRSGNHIMVATYSDGSWGAPVQIGDSLAVGIEDAYVVYDPSRNTMMVTWAGARTSFRFPYYSIYNGTDWSAPATIDTVSVYDDVFTCFDPQSNTIIATWINTSSPQIPYYSIFDGTEWSVPASFGGGSANVYYDVSVAYNPTLLATIATWTNRTGPNVFPSFSIYNETSWQAVESITTDIEPYGLTYVTFTPFFATISPPTSLRGTQKKNRFSLVFECYNTIKWASSPSSGVMGYNIYKNGQRIASVGVDTLSYVQHNQPFRQMTTYAVTAFDANNNESEPISVTLP